MLRPYSMTSKSNMPKSSFLRRLRGAQAWRHGLVYPFYVPEDLSNIRELLSSGQLREAVAELWRSSSLGSGSAAALLEYMCLRDGTLCGTDRDAVADQCRESAYRRNAFAQYIFAWCEYEKGNRRLFYRLLIQSARQRFPPAMGDLGRLVSAQAKKTKKHRKLATFYFQLAIRNGHLMSIGFLLNGFKQGAYGNALRPIGVVLLPLSAILISPITRLFPFSISVFAYPVGLKKPLFK
jgi:hypothetical protein